MISKFCLQEPPPPLFKGFSADLKASVLVNSSYSVSLAYLSYVKHPEGGRGIRLGGLGLKQLEN